MTTQGLLSRAAEAIFWMARYVERAENVARMIEVNLHLTLDSTRSTTDQWIPLYEVANDEEAFKERYPAPSQANVIRFLTFDTTYGNSIASCLYQARENARSVREIISSEMWEQLNKFYLMVRNASPEWVSRHPSEFYFEIRTASHLFEGISAATMSHSEAWNFATMGRMLERADQTSRILDVKYFVLLPKVEYVGSPVDHIQWGAVLKSVSGFEMYRKEYGRLDPAQMVHFLILNQEFPRSVAYGLSAARDALYTVTKTPNGSYRFASERLLNKLRSDVMYGDPKEIVIAGLHEYLDHLQFRLNEVSEAVRTDFFAPPDPDPVSILQGQG